MARVLHTPLDRDWTRRSVLAAGSLLPFAGETAWAALPPWTFFVNVNLQGLEGSNVLPGRAGTDYFVPSSSDLDYLTPWTSGPFRLPFKWERLQPLPGGPLDVVYLAEIKSVADAAARLGRTIILDCHNYMHRSVGACNACVDANDGILTRQHLADLWSRTAEAFAGHPGVDGWDLMNEPQGLTDGQSLAVIMQASVDAISEVDKVRRIYVEGDRYSSSAQWTNANPGYPLSDRHDRLVYSAHCYPDYDASGTHFDYAGLAEHHIADTVLVDRTKVFAKWCVDRGLRGHIGETNVGIDNPRWLNVLQLGLAFWKERSLPVNLWMYGANFGANPFNLFPATGHEAPQWRVISFFAAT